MRGKRSARAGGAGANAGLGQDEISDSRDNSYGTNQIPMTVRHILLTSPGEGLGFHSLEPDRPTCSRHSSRYLICRVTRHLALWASAVCVALLDAPTMAPRRRPRLAAKPASPGAARSPRDSAAAREHQLDQRHCGRTATGGRNGDPIARGRVSRGRRAACSDPRPS
jgi:hypothetical protein